MKYKIIVAVLIILTIILGVITAFEINKKLNETSNTSNNTLKNENNNPIASESATPSETATESPSPEPSESVPAPSAITNEEKAEKIAKQEWEKYRSSEGLYFKSEPSTNSSKVRVSVRDMQTTAAIAWYEVDINANTAEMVE